MTRNLKTLQIIGSSNPGGAEAYFVRFVRALRAHCEVTAVVKRGSWISEQLSTLDIQHEEMRFGGLFDFGTRVALLRLVGEGKYHIAQTWMSRASKHFPSRADIPWVCRLGGYYKLKYYRGANALIGNTEDICEYIKRDGWPSHKVAYLPNFVDPPPPGKILSKNELRVELGIPIETTVLFCAGRFHENKGYDLVLSALEHLPKDTHFLLVGDGVKKAALVNQIQSLDLDGRVHIFPWADNVSHFAGAADIWLVPSRVEPLGNVVIEAWSNGIPVVASNTVGPLSLIADMETGVLFESEKTTDLIKKIQLVSNNRPLIDALVKNGRERYQKNFSEEIVIKSWLNYYEAALKP